MLAALVAAAVVAAGQLLGWHGVDTPAQVYRVELFHRAGFVLWDFGWYGGHWTLDYSVLYPLLAGIAGISVLAVASAALAALAFDRLARGGLGRGGAPASAVFAVGTLVSASIGQLTFLTGEAFGLCALWALARRRPAPAVAAALVCTLTSPLTGAFLALAAAGWALGPMLSPGRGVRLPSRRRLAAGALLGAVAVIPVLAGVILFPGDGPMPYPVTDWVWELVIAAVVGILAGRSQPHLLVGAGLWMIAATGSELVPSALGGNIGRLEDLVALPLAVGVAWSRPLPRRLLAWSRPLPRRLSLLDARSGSRPLRGLMVLGAGVPLALSQWAPAAGAITSAPALASTQRSFYIPLDRALTRLAAAGPAGRVEVVPTEYHWEAAWVAPVVPLARGWERQLDVADNPIFYRPGPLSPIAYRDWLIDNGVRFVAVPDAPLDTAGRAEAALIRSGSVPGLLAVWTDPDWRLFRVEGSPGIVSGPARLVRASGTSMVLDATAAGTVTVRVRYSSRWRIASGAGCLTRADPSWLSLTVARTERVRLHLSLFSGAAACP